MNKLEQNFATPASPDDGKRPDSGETKKETAVTGPDKFSSELSNTEEIKQPVKKGKFEKFLDKALDKANKAWNGTPRTGENKNIAEIDYNEKERYPAISNAMSKYLRELNEKNGTNFSLSEDFIRKVLFNKNVVDIKEIPTNEEIERAVNEVYNSFREK